MVPRQLSIPLDELQLKARLLSDLTSGDSFIHEL